MEEAYERKATVKQDVIFIAVVLCIQVLIFIIGGIERWNAEKPVTYQSPTGNFQISVPPDFKEVEGTTSDLFFENEDIINIGVMVDPIEEMNKYNASAEDVLYAHVDDLLGGRPNVKLKNKKASKQLKDRIVWHTSYEESFNDGSECVYHFYVIDFGKDRGYAYILCLCIPGNLEKMEKKLME